MNSKLRNKYRGFTLIELITVIVILGVLAVGISGFLQFGTSIYAQSHTRDKLIGGARFAIERLNREVRHALPNSISTSTVSGAQCLIFTPIHTAAIYADIPVSPEPAANTVSLIPFDNSLIINATDVIVYPTKVSDVNAGSGKVFSINSLNTGVTPWILTLNNTINFTVDSPTQRLFFIAGQTTFCVSASGVLTRNGTILARDINPLLTTPFTVTPATLQRNAIVKVELIFELNDEQAAFNNEIQVPNVP